MAVGGVSCFQSGPEIEIDSEWLTAGAPPPARRATPLRSKVSEAVGRAGAAPAGDESIAVRQQCQRSVGACGRRLLESHARAVQRIQDFPGELLLGGVAGDQEATVGEQRCPVPGAWNRRRPEQLRGVRLRVV